MGPGVRMLRSGRDPVTLTSPEVLDDHPFKLFASDLGQRLELAGEHDERLRKLV